MGLRKVVIKTVKEICPEILKNSSNKSTIKTLVESSLKYGEENNLEYMQFTQNGLIVFLKNKNKAMAKKTITVKHFIGQTPEGQAAEWMTQEDWEKHWKYVEECKKNGTYGKEMEFTIELKDDCFFDNKKGLIIDSNTEMIQFKPLKTRFKILDYGSPIVKNPINKLPEQPK